MSESIRPRYLTKSRFKLALECPTKLFYSGKSDLYPDAKQDDEFLQALADGGFQVGELAKLMFPEGIEIEATTHEEQIAETRRLLEQHTVTLFEAAIAHGNLFARVDILRKSGTQLELIEVKAKSFDGEAQQEWVGARGGIKASMLPYLRDVAFQRYILALAFPAFSVSSFLMLADKSKTCSVDGLNQRFKINRINDRPVVTVAPGTDAKSIGAPILTCVNVDDLVDRILAEPITVPGVTGNLAQLASTWAEHYRRDARIEPAIGAQCAKCEFRTSPEQTDKRSGLHECWRDSVGFTEADWSAGTVLDLWNFKRKQDLIDQRIVRLSDVPLERLKGSDGEEGLSRGQRQRMQVTGHWPGRDAFYLDDALIRRQMAGWAYPLHFIDFETACVPIPFFAGQRPYANIAFQFSHHVVLANGRVEHRTQFLSTKPGLKPNYAFARQLQAALGHGGTVFMWSHHEKTTLDAIAEELARDPAPPPDARHLLNFIRGLTAVVDLCHLAQRAYFHPATKGSSSIKKVLPAVMQSSPYLRRRYGQPIYGAKSGIKSLNFVDQIWWQEKNGVVVDPYKLLPPVFADLPIDATAELDADGDLEIAQGGAATTAYARLQFEDIALLERRSIEAALLRYCELDTLAMVMVVEAWREWI